jgi:ribosomal protein S8
MPATDPISDFFTRFRKRSLKPKRNMFDIPSSKMKVSLAES